MSIAKTKIDQKEYLKRYLSNDKDKKKKKKKKDKHALGKLNVKIIDDDDTANPHQLQNEDESDLFALGEEAPQIVGIIDERPPELKAKEDFNTSKWKKLSVDNENNWGNVPKSNDSNIRSGTYATKSNRSNSPCQSSNSNFAQRDEGMVAPHRDSDESPPRRRNARSPTLAKGCRRGVNSPRKRCSRINSDSDASPPRKTDRYRNDGEIRKIKVEYDSDQSPPRKSSTNQAQLRNTGESSRKARRNSDESPPRRRLENKYRKDSDQSPPRRGQSSKERVAQRRRDSDASPPRRTKASIYDRDIKEERSHSKSHSRVPDTRHIKQEIVSSDESPPRRRHLESNESSHRRRERTQNSSPLRSIKKEPRDDDSGTLSKKMTTTLDGKIAGLQDAKAMRVENERFRRREAEVFESMSAETSGRYAKTVVREKHHKRREDVEEELRKEFEKRKRDEKKKEVYTRWGKGVKQVEEYKAQLQEAAHEMNKPLARYADDQDLDEYLKKQERLGDPMLDYIRSKKKEKAREEGRPEKPIYKGSFMDNRFGIRPGYRWDGVDRSNGFEKKWFEMQSKKKAVEEEAYKYSVEDM
ncbi:BUD13 homolog [Wyeomyia smithii]|uniref:BUD13 homolog n=1 Tax=Wyeomyia smithii TaxID=174621 RepID=UPI002467D44C|nr:BUD13 homolog [Wyeomyia smithii]